MTAKTRLELTWIGKSNRPRVEPRILIEDERLSHHAATRREGDLFDNILIHGDNLLALRALEQDFTGKVKCVFIDPPYNTGSAFEHYDDGLEHSIWLSMMRDRLEIIRRLMSEDGSLWVTLDDNEARGRTRVDAMPVPQAVAFRVAGWPDPFAAVADLARVEAPSCVAERVAL